MTRLARALTCMAVVVLGAASPAMAQTSGPGSYPPSGGTAVLDFGVQREGAAFTKEDCGFAPASSAQVSLNGRDIFTKAAEGDGCVRLTVVIQNRTTVRIDGTDYGANRCAANSIGVSGTHRDGGTLTYDNRFTIDCSSGAAGAAVARTGADGTVDLSVAGAGLVVVGVVLAIVARRRRSAALLAEA